MMKLIIILNWIVIFCIIFQEKKIVNIIKMTTNHNGTSNMFEEVRNKLNELYRKYGRGMFNVIKASENKALYDKIFKLTDYIKDEKITFATRCYLIYHGMKNFPLCKTCNEPIINSVKSFSRGFYDYCSIKCQSNSKEVKEKRDNTKEKRYGDRKYNNHRKTEETNLKKYGFKTNLQNEDNKIKARKTKLEKYGDEFFTNQEKRNETNLEKYGSINPLGNEKVLEKRNDTMMKKYGVLYTMQSRKLKKKVQKTNIERYGKINSCDPEKARKTKLEKYGDENWNNRELAKKTCIERYKKSSYTQTKEFNRKIRRTCLKKYGATCYLRSKEGIKKTKETNLRKYGCENYSSSEESRKHTSDRKQKEFYDRLMKNEHLKLLSSYDEFKTRTPITKLKWKCLDCGEEFEQKLNRNFGQSTEFHTYARCFKCYPYEYGHSSSEKELLKFIRDNYKGEVVNGLGSRKIIFPLEIDIYIPELKLGIEYDGLYWHSELGGKEKEYHLYKTEECEKRGIKLIHIFSDEWEERKDEIKKFLMYEIENTKYEIGRIVENNGIFNYIISNNVICSFRYKNNSIIDLFGNINKDIIFQIGVYIKNRYSIEKVKIILDRRFYSIDEIIGFDYKIKGPKYWIVDISDDKKYSKKDFKLIDDGRTNSKIWDCGYFEIII